jgi:ion channel-forming bestrophin family protein
MLTKDLPVKAIVQFSFLHIALAVLWSSAIVAAFVYLEWHWLAVPFLPISVIGIAVSFYVGFKNNAANERQNEARRNWGGITNDSRAWAAMLNTYLPDDNAEAEGLKHQLIKRHIAWLYAHKSFLRHKRMAWEHNAPLNNVYRARFQKDFGINTELAHDIAQYISPDELKSLETAPNVASALLQYQSQTLKQLRSSDLIEDFRLFELQNHITKLYEHQGKNERIKSFPIPRQYASYANLFVTIFSFLLPLGMLNETKEMNIWLTIPFSTLVIWVFQQMALIGEYSEHPFEGLIGDVPLAAIARNIEIELRYTMGEKDLPQPIAAVNGVLM